MVEIDPITGLPKELGTWETITKENQEITISLESKKFGKKYTIISGLDEKDINLNDLTKKLKSKLACGGTAKKGQIELQGNHIQRVKENLLELGFTPDTIIVKQ